MPVAENGMVWSQPTFIKAIKDFFTWCDDFRDEIRICEWSDSDLCQVLKEMILKDYRPEENEIKYLLEWQDVQKLYDITFDKTKCTALGEAIWHLDLDVKGKLHDALFDAENTAAILRILSNEAEVALVKEKMKAYTNPGTLTCSLGDLFDFSKYMAVSA